MSNNSKTILIIVLAILLICCCMFVFLAAAGAYLYVAEPSGSPQTVRQVTPFTTRDEQPVQIPEATNAPSASERERPQGGELRLPGGMPPTLDPALSQDSTSAQYMVEIFSGLVTANPDLELVPDIAESYEVSENGTVYTFHLRHNVRFHSGRPVTASDFKFSLERSCDPRTGSTVASTYLGDIVGAAEMLMGQATELAGVRVVDEYTLEIEIDAPRPSFLAKLTHPVAFVVDRDSINSNDPLQRANGTGPFILTELTPRTRIVLEANRNYYREPMPSLDRVIYLMSGGYPVTMYENDELDVAAVGTADLPRITDPASGLSDQLTVSEQLSTFYIGLNCRKPPFDDVKVRQAFSMALDRQKIVDLLYEGTVPAASTFVPPHMPDYDSSSLSVPEFDPEAAQTLLAQSSYGSVANLPTITLSVSSASAQTDPIAEAIAVILEENLGVSIAIEQTDWEIFLEELSQPENPYQMFMLGWIADYPDPENFLNVLFNSASSDNQTHYQNSEVDQLLAAAGLELDQAERYQLYLNAEEIILAEAPVIPLYHDVEYWLTKPYVKGMYYPAMIVPKMQYVYFE